VDADGKFIVNDASEREQVLDVFESACLRAGINFSIHYDRDIALVELLAESKEADLILIGIGSSLCNHKAEFFNNLVAWTHCPVLVLPENTDSVKKISWLYDGSPGCIKALRMMGCMLPLFSNLPLEILAVHYSPVWRTLPEPYFLNELLAEHPSGIVYRNFCGETPREICKYLQDDRQESLVVSWINGRQDVWESFTAGENGVLLNNLQWASFIVKY